MNIFKKGKNRKRKKRQSTEEQQYRKAQLKTKIFLEKTAMEMAQQDEALKRQWVAQTFGFTLPDPSEEQERKLRAVIDGLTISQIEQDTEIRRKIANAKIYQVMTAEGLTRDSEEVRNRPSAMSRFTTQMEEVRRLKEVMGIKEPGFLDALTHPEVLKSIFSLIPPILTAISGEKDASNTGEAMVLVQLNGEMKQITMSEFEKLKKEGRVKLAGAEEPTKSGGSNNPGETHSKLG
jgi:hypothetical protein